MKTVIGEYWCLIENVGVYWKMVLFEECLCLIENVGVERRMLLENICVE